MDAPWLRIAKRLPVGGQTRFRCCGSDKAAVAFNNPADWSGYCHRCKEPMYQRKQYAEFIQVEPEKPVAAAPADVISIADANEFERESAYKFIINKGLMPDMVPNLCYSRQARRLVFPLTQALSLGRATMDWMKPKWIQYGGKSSFALTTPKTLDVRGIVLTEDYLSALKVQYASNRFGSGDVVCAALLGTRLDSKLKLFIAENHLPTTLMLDGDRAGYDGIKRITKDLGIYTKVRSYTIDGLDPKDMTMQQILEGLDGCSNSKGTL